MKVHTFFFALCGRLVVALPSAGPLFLWVELLVRCHGLSSMVLSGSVRKVGFAARIFFLIIARFLVISKRPDMDLSSGRKDDIFVPKLTLTGLSFASL